MKPRTMLIGLGFAAALAAGAYSYTASAQGGPGWDPGWMGGGGPDWMMGGGPGNCPGFRPGGGRRWGPGYHMRGWGGGPGMMGWGYGPGEDGKTLNLTTDDVKTRVERWLAWRGNPRLKVGEVKEKDADTITADIVTKDNSLVQRFIVDRHTGFFRQDNS